MHENDFQLLRHAIENMMPANKILGLKIVETQDVTLQQARFRQVQTNFHYFNSL